MAGGEAAMAVSEEVMADGEVVMVDGEEKGMPLLIRMVQLWIKHR